jgi:hypothetical protein
MAQAGDTPCQRFDRFAHEICWVLSCGLIGTLLLIGSGQSPKDAMTTFTSMAIGAAILYPFGWLLCAYRQRRRRPEGCPPAEERA